MGLNNFALTSPMRNFNNSSTITCLCWSKKSTRKRASTGSSLILEWTCWPALILSRRYTESATLSVGLGPYSSAYVLVFSYPNPATNKTVINSMLRCLFNTSIIFVKSSTVSSNCVSTSPMRSCSSSLTTTCSYSSKRSIRGRASTGCSSISEWTCSLVSIWSRR